MKIYKIIFTGILVGMSLCFSACDGMNDLHIGYLEQGEAIYAAKVDSISPGPGNERIEMEVFVKSQRIETVRFYWNAYGDSIDFKINSQVGVFKFMIENIPEGEYLFQVVDFDKYGNKSLPYELSSPAYGEYYRSYLVNRRIESITQTADFSMNLTWGNVSEDALYTTLFYQNSKGEEVVRVVPASETEELISDFKPLSEFRYRTAYRPATNSPDIFETNEATDSFPEIVIPIEEEEEEQEGQEEE